MTAEEALGPLRVRVDPARAAEFAREIGFASSSDKAPLSYPAVWLSEPQIRAAIERLCAEADSLPLHESQRFAYDAPLQVGVDYDLLVSIRREENPPRLAIEARLATLDDAPVGRIETLLRLAPRSALLGDAKA